MSRHTRGSELKSGRVSPRAGTEAKEGMSEGLGEGSVLYPARVPFVPLLLQSRNFVLLRIFGVPSSKKLTREAGTQNEEVFKEDWEVSKQ